MTDVLSKLARELFPHLKLKDKNLTVGKKIYIYSNIVAQLFIVLWLSLFLVLPYISQEKYQFENISFYLHDNQVKASEAKDYFNKIYIHITKNKLYHRQTDMAIQILNDRLMYGLLNPIEWLPHRQSFAVTHNKTVFVCNADIADNKAYASNDAEENLDAILVHEAVHVMQNSRYGWFYSSFKMTYWVKEGYPIYSARNLSVYKEKEIIEYMTKTNDVQIEAWSIFEQDQFYGLMVKHAIEHMHKSVDDLHLGKVDYNEVLNSLLDEYNISKT